MTWKADRTPSARGARKAMLARRVARHAFKAGMEAAFALCNEFVNAKEKFDGTKNWFEDLQPGLAAEFKHYAYHKYREIKYKERMFSKYQGMAELYREICISQDACTEARERRQCLPVPARDPTPEAEVQEPSTREMRAVGRA